MPWETGPSQIAYEELTGYGPSPARRYKRDGIDATRIVKVDWPNVDGFCQDMLGDTFVAGGSGAVAVAVLSTGSVSSLTLISGGSGYTSPPTVVFSGGGGTGAAGTAQILNGKVSKLMLTSGGTDYTSAPSVTLMGGGGTGASALAGFGGAPIAEIVVVDPGEGYTTPPRVMLTGGGGSEGQAAAEIDGNGHVTAVTVTNPGFGYRSPPAVMFANYTARRMPIAYPNWWTDPWIEILPPEEIPQPNSYVASVSIVDGGRNYTSPPIVDFNPPAAPGLKARGVSVIENGSVVRVNITFPGYGYDAAHAGVQFQEGGGEGATAVVGLEPLRPLFPVECVAEPLPSDIATEGGMENVHVTDPGGFAKVTITYSDLPYRVGRRTSGAPNNSFDLDEDGFPYFTEETEAFSGKDAPLPPQTFRRPDGTPYNEQIQFPIGTSQVTLTRHNIALVPVDLVNLIGTINAALDTDFFSSPNFAGRAPGTLRLLSYDKQPQSSPSGQRLYNLKILTLYIPAGHNNFPVCDGRTAPQFQQLTTQDGSTVFQEADWTPLFA